MLQSFDLRSAIISVNLDMTTRINGSSQNGNSTQLFLCNDFIVPPSHTCSQERNIHPTTMVGDEHCVLHFFSFVSLKVVDDDISIDNLRIASSKSHQSHTPDMANKYRDSTLHMVGIRNVIMNSDRNISDVRSAIKGKSRSFHCINFWYLEETKKQYFRKKTEHCLKAKRTFGSNRPRLSQ